MSYKSLNRLVDAWSIKPIKYQEDQLIRVNQVIGKAALIYEKIRNAIDYREEHLLRKNALFRILKRKLMIEKILINQTEDKLAEQIVQEMIRAGYLKNNQEPQEKILKIQFILEKYNYFIQHADLKQDQFNWILELEACEMEEILVSPLKELAMVRFAFEVMTPRIVTKNGELEEKEKELQSLLAMHRALRKADTGMLRYVLWTLYYPNWQAPDSNYVFEIAKQFKEISKEIDSQLKHPWKKSLDKIARNNAIVFWSIQDVIEKNPAKALEIFSDPEQTKNAIMRALEKRYKTVKRKLATGVVRSIIYVFFTKMLLAILIEFPLDMMISKQVNYMALTTNILFPPVIMLFVALAITTPGKANTDAVLAEVKSMMFSPQTASTFAVKEPHKRHILTRMILNLLYLCVFSASIYFIYKGLSLIGFNWVSIMIFIFFLSIVSFFGIRIKRPVKEIMIVQKRDNIFSLLIDLFSLPFATFGRWLSFKFSKVNFIAFIFDFIIEAPFKIFIEVLEDLFKFWREKKDEAFEGEE
jgi:hypothetical protein